MLRAKPGAARQFIFDVMQGHPQKGAAGALADALAVLDRADQLKAGGYAPYAAVTASMAADITVGTERLPNS
jgi:hypothetical protein